jgi:hypothetical protein
MARRKVELAGYAHRLGFGLDAVELDAVVEPEPLAASQPPEKVEMPP